MGANLRLGLGGLGRKTDCKADLLLELVELRADSSTPIDPDVVIEVAWAIGADGHGSSTFPRTVRCPSGPVERHKANHAEWLTAPQNSRNQVLT